MKRNKIMFVIAIVAILSVLFVACDEGTQPEHTHTYGAWTVTTAPTEDTAGSATRACACGDVQTTTVAKLSDTTVWTVTVSQDATHTSKGFKVYKSAYGTVTVTIEKTTGHTYGAWTLTKNPTTTETGTAKRSCVCGYEEETPVAALTDASVWTTAPSQDPTHESKGFVQYTSEYGTVLVEVAAGQHTYNNWTLKTAPTLTETGLALKTCVCGHYEEETVAVLTDTTVWAKQHTDATHQAAGSDVYTSVYGTVTIVIPQIEHSFTGEYRDNADGTHSRKCTGCDAYSTAVEHDFSKKVIDDAHKATDADCTNAATYYYSCECGAVSTELTFENGKALGHNYSEFKVTKEPTCTETGIAESVCKTCQETQTNIIAANGHKYTQYAPVMDTDYWGDTEIELDTSQRHVKKCEVCGVKATSEEVHKYGKEYLYVDNADYAYAYKDCTLCGYTDKEHATSLGELSTWTVKETKVADYNQAGYTIYTKGTYEYRKEFAKLVAPYDGKTYYSYNFHINDNGVFAIETAWSSAQITFNENGVGTGTAHPFRGTTTITMVNAETGEINWESGTSNFKGYVNFETGVIIRSESGETFDRVFMMIPVDRGVTSSDILGSDLGDGMAVTFTAQCDLHERHTSNFAISDEKVFFDVNFEGKDGNALTVDNIANSDYVKVCAKDGTVLAAYQKNANGVFQKTDGKEGTYNDATYGDVVLNGIGGATIGENTGVYSYNADKACYELYVGTSQADATAYYTFTLTDGAIALTKPMTTITYVTAYGADTIGDAYKSVNNNIKLVLPTFEGFTETEGNVFVGWTVEGQEGVVKEYTPTGADVTFTAVWRAPLTVTIKDGAAGETITKQVPYGEEIGAYLPTWDIDGNRRFVGWFVDLNDDGIYDAGSDEEFDPATPATENITLIAVWKEIPAYVGTYYGYELWGKDITNNGKALTIDVNGKMTGYKSGTITSYDATTKKVIWSGGEFYFDADAKIILGLYSTPNIGTDLYFFSQSMTTADKIAANYAVYARDPITNQTGFYARFIEAKTALSDNTIVFTFGNKIYSGVEIKDTLGKTLVIDKNQANSIEKSASVVVYKDGKVIFARAAAEGKVTIGDSTSSSYMPRELDAYFGTYTCEGQDSLVFGGTGEFAWGEKSGTYTVTDADAKKFGLYVADKDGKKIEYYEVTLNGSTYADEKPMVTVTYTTAITPKEALEASVQVNKNIEITLPTLTNADNMFRGWLIEGDETLYNGAYEPVANVDFTAKWDTKYTFKAVYNDGVTEEFTKDYGMGDVVNINAPVWAKHRFDGWFTTSTFDEGTEWISGSEITANLTIYAKWSDCIYAQKYTFAYVGGSFATKSDTTFVTRRTSAEYAITFDGTGKGTFGRTDHQETLPFSDCSSTNSYSDGNGWGSERIYLGYEISISAYDETTGKVTFTAVKKGKTTNTTYTYYGIVDKATGIIVASYKKDTETITNFAFFMPDGCSVSVSYASTWDGNKAVMDYVVNGATRTLFVDNGTVYLDAKVVDIDGNHIACNDVAKAECVLIYASQDAEAPLYSLGYDGTQLVDLDGYQGTYTTVDGTITLDGVGGVTLADNTVGTYTKAADGAVYTFDVKTTNMAYKLTVDKEARTWAIEENRVTVTYVNDKKVIENGAPGVGVQFRLPSGKDVEVAGYIFRGWYDNAEFSGNAVTEVTLTENATYYAKYDVAVSLTFDYSGYEYETGKTTQVVAGKYINDTLGNVIPTVASDAIHEGKAFAGWFFKDGEIWGDQVSSSTALTQEVVTIYARWIEPAAAMGTYKGFEVYSVKKGTEKANSALSTVLTINADGSYSGKRDISGKLSADDAAKTNGAINITRYAYLSDALGGIVIFGWSASDTSVGSDFYIAFKNAANITKVEVSGDTIGGGYVAFFTVSYTEDGTAKTMNLFVYNNEIIANVMFTDGVTAKAAATTTEVLVKDATGKPIVKKSGSALLGNDGKGGSYNGTELGEVVLDGYGTITVSGKNVAYTLNADKTQATFVLNNQMRVIALGNGTYTLALDGYQGEYTLPDATSKLTLDGHGNAGTGTYVVNGANITIYNGGASTTYGLDVAGKNLLGKSIFAGLTFSGTGVTITFDDDVNYSGIIKIGSGQNVATLKFTATFDGTTLTMSTLESNGVSWDGGRTWQSASDFNSKVIVATLSGNTFTVASSTTGNQGGYPIVGKTATCADYQG